MGDGAHHVTRDLLGCEQMLYRYATEVTHYCPVHKAESVVPVSLSLMHSNITQHILTIVIYY